MLRALVVIFAVNAFSDPANFSATTTDASPPDNTINPKIASRLLTTFSTFKKFDKAHQEKVRKVLGKLIKKKGLSTDAKETIERILA